jgi:hypothetical protein
MTRFQNRQQAIAARATILTESEEAFRYNTKLRRDYVERLTGIKLTDYQEDCLIGLLLSDATVDFSSVHGHRIKIQQSKDHLEWLKTILNDFIEYTAGTGILTLDRPNMYELNTLTCKAFEDILPLFYEKDKTLKGIKDGIKPFITPVTVANWFNGDGCKRSDGEDKGIIFNTQGFTEAECNILAKALVDNLGLDAYAGEDTHKSANQKYVVIVSGTSFDSFIEQVGPYIHPCFKSKLPTPRSDNSRHGYMTSKLFESLVSSKLIGDCVDTYKRPKYK